MKEAVIKIVGSILAFVLIIILIALLQALLEEKPHTVVIDGKKYMRSKEYVGRGQYQIILVPISDSTVK